MMILMPCDVSLRCAHEKCRYIAMRKLEKEGMMRDGHDGNMTILCFGDRRVSRLPTELQPYRSRTQYNHSHQPIPTC